ncbi:hypothetical protein FCM35_KLT12328 [Carex littledalei]|uniref:Uncharacterized protein n=1 Tax=Carex littledalei TaxID=544730 RepID=A0A833QR52_9POAL|nr:hypothetical protein FCM35_KLT12328 [Carex littledalei]
MSEGIGATQALQPNPDSVQQISKRKPDSPPLDGSDDTRRTSKTPRLDQDQNARPCHDLSAENGEKEKVVDKGKTKEEEKEPDQNLDHNTDVSVDKGKGKMIVQENEAELDQNRNPSSRAFVDKGKGKMIMVEEEDSSDDSNVACVASGSDSDYSDDPLMEVDLNNILPSRTRRWAPPVPGAYLVPPDQDDDEDDDDDDDASDDGVAVDDDDDNDSESE